MKLTKGQVKHVAKNKFRLNLKGKTAVFIDAANLELPAKDLGFKVDYKKLSEWLNSQVKIVFLGFYTARFDTKEGIRKPVFYNGRLITICYQTAIL